ncbi:hypothetical protein GUJ93_ZPchr0006g44246 [Zizania palustris]|uniref:Uncharacterized protein n=1 Tax=Zizania palustris TaxID=103762 RepID=A0A8J5SSR9_ZIZPA|nr:hypothetical protein GUJ93_ZPchr0006g44246 [Zizania palustris]
MRDRARMYAPVYPSMVPYVARIPACSLILPKRARARRSRSGVAARRSGITQPLGRSGGGLYAVGDAGRPVRRRALWPLA